MTPAPRTDEAASPRLVVGIGVSAASLPSLARLFAHWRPGNGAAAIVVMQQREALDEEPLLRAIGQNRALPVAITEDGAAIERDRIYLAPADRLLTVAGGRFEARPAREAPGERGLIDSLLVSLALDQRERAAAIVLAGIGTDGTLGIRAMKEQGGLTMAEAVDDDPAGHAAGAPASGLVDFVLLPEHMAERLEAYAGHLAREEEAPGRATAAEQASAHLAAIAAILRDKTGHDFHGYKHNTFMRRVQRRMHVVQVDDLDGYIAFLRRNQGEVHKLFQDLLISVTQFFRDAKEFAFVETEVIPHLFEHRQAGDQVRVWVLGCATGEEAYSIAILLREHVARLETVPQVQIFATDIDARALAVARVGRYPDSIARDVTAERLARWFVREGNTYCVAKELREMCIFSSHNLIRDAPFSRIDLISCRNLLIYLNADLQNRVIPLFHFALRPGGVLFLGPSETVTRHSRLFTPIDKRYRIFRRADTTTRHLPEFPLAATLDRREPDPRRGADRRVGDGRIGRRAERIAERYAPAFVVVDEHYEVLHFSGRTGRYLDPSSGAASFNLLNLVHRDLRLDLRAVLHRATSQNTVAAVEKVRMAANGDRVAVNLVVEPIPGEAGEPQTYVVLFQDGEILPAGGEEESEVPSSHRRDEHIRQIESELRATRERLQATIEELESANEELKSSNEEYQSINEELQSANEELETSKEELQSLNEELQTVNGELGHRVSELARANSDLKNLFESTQIATLFVDNDLRIKNYTPAATDVFHLIESDIGRPITHIAPRIAYEDLSGDVRKVLRTLATIEREIENARTGARYLVRVLPYRSIDNFIAGAVLTFADVTATARAERALRETEERFRMMAQTVPAFLFTAKPNLEWDYVNPRFYDYTGLSDGAALGRGWLVVVHPDDVEENQRRWRRAAETGEPFEMVYRIRNIDGAYRWFLGRAQATRDAQGHVVKWLGSCTDIHERRLAEDRRRLLLAELQHRVKNILAVVRSIASRTAETSPSLEDFAAHFDGRVGALARTQNVLTRTADGTLDLEELVREELVAHAARDDGQVRISGPAVRLHQQVAETLGLAVHELATNAIKYGALARPGGQIAVTWRVHGGSRLTLEWRETGVPIVDSSPRRSGFGRELIERGLPYELGAATVLEFGRGGVRCVIELPLDERVGLARSNVAGRSASGGIGDDDGMRSLGE